ncbi:MAG: acyl-CoA synthetase [Pseudomonadota bacterium]
MPRTREVNAEKRAPEWLSAPERSNTVALRLIVWVALTLGRPVARSLLFPICVYFICFSSSARIASQQYLARVLGRAPHLGDSYRHIHTFASTILDRVFLLNDRYDMLDVHIHGAELAQDLIAHSQSCIFLGAHLGSFEIIRSFSRTVQGPPVAVVMYEENARKLHTVLHAINPQLKQQIIGLGKADSMLKVEAALQRGEFVALLADRALEGEGSAAVEFLGAPAMFPTGPLRIALMLKQPVMLMIGLYRGGSRYDVYFEELADMRNVNRGQRNEVLDQALQKYVARVEYHCRNAPYNWFNFFDFWKAP